MVAYAFNSNSSTQEERQVDLQESKVSLVSILNSVLYSERKRTMKPGVEVVCL